MEQSKMNSLGIDIGSTTVKISILDPDQKILFSAYKRHYANIQETLSSLLSDAHAELGDLQVSPMITGSGGLTLAKHLGVPFVQEVIAVSTALTYYAPKTDVAIELGGEDAKIIYFEGGNVEQRMNGICAGGTGSFIDQMAALLQTDAAGLNEYAKDYKAIYPIAARCGVFAKIRHPAPDQRGRYQGRPGRLHFPGSGQPDHQRPGLRQTHPGPCGFPGWPACTSCRSFGTAFIRTLKLDEEHTIAPEPLPPVRGHRFGHELTRRKVVPCSRSDMARKLSGKDQDGVRGGTSGAAVRRRGGV